MDNRTNATLFEQLYCLTHMLFSEQGTTQRVSFASSQKKPSNVKNLTLFPTHVALRGGREI